MPFSLLPTMITHSVTDLTPEFLKSRNIQLLMLDFDNTIVPYTTDVPTDRMEKWLREMSTSDVQICVVSNSKRDRVKVFCEKYGIDCITHAKKPFSRGIRQCLEKYQIDEKFAALAGDQIYTDVLGGNGCGLQTILIDAINNHNIWLKLRHVAEMPFIAMARGRKL